MSDVNLNDFRTLYLTTADEYLQKMVTNLATLTKDPSDTRAIEEVHISAHSLKSQSLVMGYQTMGELAHVIELIFRKAQDEKSALSPEILIHVQEAVRDLRFSLEKVTEIGKENDLTEQVTTLKQLAGV